METIQKFTKALHISHLGLGDHITNIGAINFLLQYYDTIHIVCTANNRANIELLFNNTRVVTIIVSSYQMAVSNPIIQNFEENDIFVSGGMFKNKLKSRITHPQLLKYKPNNKNYTTKYGHIDDFYREIGLDLSIYNEYFNIDSTDISQQYYSDIKDYKIVFIHTTCSLNKIDLSNVIRLYKQKDDYIIICADFNAYNINDIKYILAAKYVNISIVYYIDIIKNAERIHIVDSCFSCIVIPLLNMKQISPKEVKIYHRMTKSIIISN
jgi:hypothetical protein